ncbi:MAG: FtsX-like permease family protein [Geobacteraceae bacterium]|nr:FtsX-like permease family protein [Geobacteraceae bacterium]
MGGVEKQRCIIDFTLSSLLRRKGKNGALLVVYTLVVFLLASVMLFTQAIRKEAAAVLADAPELVVQRIVAGRHDLIPLDYMGKIGAIRGVRAVSGRLWGYYYDPLFGANYTLVVPEEQAGGLGEIAVGQGVARSSMASEGNIMPFHTHDGRLVSLTVARVLPASTELVSSDLILLTAEDFRMLFGVPAGVATDLVVAVANPAEVPTIAAKIARLLPDTRPIARSEILRTYDAAFSWRSGILLAILAGALLAFLIFAWDKATGLSAEERREIGILKAVGWETGDVLAMKFWEGSVISLSAFLAGVVLAYLHVFVAAAPLFEPVLKGWSVLYPRFRLTPSLDFAQLAVLFFLVVVPYAVATIVPAWRAATVDPDAVMRG